MAEMNDGGLTDSVGLLSKIEQAAAWLKETWTASRRRRTDKLCEAGQRGDFSRSPPPSQERTDLRLDEDCRGDEKTAASWDSVGGMDVHLRGCRLQPGTDPEPVLSF